MSETNQPNFGELMKKAQEMQKKMQWAQQKLSAMEVRGEAGGGMITVIVNGKYECKKVIIDPVILKEAKEIIEDLIAAAINDSVRKVEMLLKSEMQNLTKDLGIPSDN